ncbi:MAG: DNA-directed RNA polymerase subunit D [Candidatus Pacearchaeota archaeon]|jgi:DNA-directed RNA polymerase subunit D
MKEQKSKDKLDFIIETNETLANAIRRSANEIPIIAVEEVEIHKNDSALFDEIIAHRIGLIPLREKRKLNEFEKCSCEGKGCNKCQIQISLKAKGPQTVYSGEFKGDVEIIYEKMPITLLDKDQEIELIGFVKLGKAVNHAKFSPGLVYYRNISEIHVKNVEEAEKIISKLKESIINPPKGKVKSGEVYKCTKDLDYIETLLEEGSKAVELKAGEDIVFFIESWGQIEPKEIFNESVKALDKNLKEVLKVIKK